MPEVRTMIAIDEISRGGRRRGRPRRGLALVIVLVLAVICLALFGVWARSIVMEKRRLANQQYRLQAVRLAEAGVRRGQARRAADPAFVEETWAVPAEDLGGRHGGEVRIRVTPAGAGAERVEAVAEFPADNLRRAQVTRWLEVVGTPLGNEP